MSKKKIACIVGIVGIVILVAVVVILFGSKEEVYRVIKIYEIEGNGTITRNGNQELTPYANMQLQSGDVVRLEDGSMTLKLDDDKYVYVEEQTEFVIVAEGNNEDGKTRIELKSGAITNEIENPLSADSTYEVNTPNSTMAVRGTIFRVEIQYDKSGTCYTTISVFDGKVASKLVYVDGTLSDEEVMIEKDKEIIIYQNEQGTDYIGDPEDIDYSRLPESCLEILREAGIDIPKDKMNGKSKDDASKEDGKQRAYTITFIYNGSTFGTQMVKAGKCVSEPILRPEEGGSWDYDFTEPVESDLEINWN